MVQGFPANREPRPIYIWATLGHSLGAPRLDGARVPSSLRAVDKTKKSKDIITEEI